MTFDLQEFSSNFNKGGFARACNYEVLVSPPLGLGFGEEINLRCSAIDIPGRRVLSSDYLTYGPTQKVAYGAVYEEATMMIMLSADLFEKKFIQRWQDIAVGFARGTMQKVPGLYDIGYYSDYIGTVEIFQYNNTADPVYDCTLLEAWPNGVGALRGDWNSEDIHYLPVTFTFRHFVDDEGWSEAQGGEVEEIMTDDEEIDVLK